MTNTPLDDHNVFALCTLSNIADAYNLDSAAATAEARKDITKVLANTGDLIGKWELAWGPVVQMRAKSIDGITVFSAANAMFIAKTTDQVKPQFVVSIAGTDPHSLFEWLVEDGWIENLFWWNDNDHSQGKISGGTHVGLQKLNKMKDLSKPDDERTAVAYLKKHGTDPGTIVQVTGHSLGGALSPCFTLQLYQNGFPNVRCLAAAGPTPGNEAFATYLVSQLGRRLTRAWNHYDIVPHAWAEKQLGPHPDSHGPNLSQIPGLYNGDEVPKSLRIPPDSKITDLVAGAEVLAFGKGYTQLQPDLKHFSNPDSVVPVGTAKGEFARFMTEACYQHIEAYVLHFGIEKFCDAVKQILGRTHFFNCNTENYCEPAARLVQIS